MNAEISKYPLWISALDKFVATSPVPGNTLSKAWLMKEFGIDEPTTIDEYKEAQLKFLVAFERFRETLLEEHQIDLKTLPGVGYSVIHPRNQAEIALNRGAREMVGAIKKMFRSVTNVNVSELTSSERSQHADAMAKASAIKSMFNRRRLLGRE